MTGFFSTQDFIKKHKNHICDGVVIKALNLLEQRHKRSLCAEAFLGILQHPVSCQEDQVGFVFLSFLGSQQLYHLKSR